MKSKRYCKTAIVLVTYHCNEGVIDRVKEIQKYASNCIITIVDNSTQKYKQRYNLRLRLKAIDPSIIYIDHFGNVVTNIKKSFFDKIGKGRKFEISARNYKFNQIYSSYSDIINFNLTEDKRSDEGKALIIFNTNNYLQISIYKSNPDNVGTAATLLGLKIYDSVSVIFNS